jgi:nicotinamidase/pyrazinamidase
MAQQQGDGKVRPDERSVFIVVDVQNCFVPGGSLAVQKGDEVVPLINKLAKGFRNVVLTQDWHTLDHISFASQHAGKKPFELIELPYGKQVLWPDHCVQGTQGAELVKGLDIPHAQLVIRKGYLKQRGLESVFVAGLATDFCVAFTALDARKEGFSCYVVEDACRGIDAQGSLAAAWDKMGAAGVKRIQSGDIVFPA